MSLPRQFKQDRVRDLWGINAAALAGSVDLRRIANTLQVEIACELSGSLLSVQSAPPPLEATTTLPLRPASLLVDLPLAPEPSVQAYLSMSPCEQEEDSLLTLSSVTARPLLAASRNLKRKPSKHTSDSNTPVESSEIIEGGYGWVVVFGAFLVQFWVAGLFKSYGVLYIEIRETFPESSASMASWIPAILSTLCLALAPVSCALCSVFSCRAVVFTGGLFCAVGLALSYCSTNLLHLLLSFGICTGIGGGLSTTPGIVIVSQYFDKHRALANGICVSGTAAGSFVFPMLIERLCDRFGLHGTFLILGGGMLHVCAAATLYRSPPPTPRTEVQYLGSAPPTTVTTTTTEDTTILDQPEGKCDMERLEKFLNRDPIINIGNELKRNNMIAEIFHPSLIEVVRPSKPNQSESEEEEALDVLGAAGALRMRTLRLRPTRSSSLLHSVEDLSTDSTCVYKASGHKLSRSMYIKYPYPLPERLQQRHMLAELSNKTTSALPPIVKNEDSNVGKSSCVECVSRYLDVSLLRSSRFALLCGSVALMSCGTPYALYYLPAYTVAAGHSKAAAGRLVAISAAMDLCGRLGLGWLCDLNLFDRKKAYIVSVLVAGTSVLCLPVLSSWWSLAVASGAYGLCLGCWFLLVPVLLADLFGTGRIASSYGLVRMFQSVTALAVPPTAGLMRDMTGDYELCFYIMGSCMILGAVPLLFLHFCYKSDDESEIGTQSE